MSNLRVKLVQGERLHNPVYNGACSSFQQKGRNISETESSETGQWAVGRNDCEMQMQNKEKKSFFSYSS